MIYMDNAATTALSREALQEMLPYLTECYGNASSIYRFGQRARKAVEDSRRRIASLLGVRPMELYFTSGGTEADNWALLAAAENAGGGHIITSAIEHHAVLNSCKYLERRGFSVSYLPVDKRGFVRPETLEREIREDTFLISIMAANNEIGTVQPIAELGTIAHRHGILFHTDAVQAFGQIPIDIEGMHIDLLSASAHKLYGPKGVGLLYLRRSVRLPALLHGGAQERGKRAGTENVAGIAGFARAAELAFSDMSERAARESVLRDHLIARIEREIPDCFLNGDRRERLPNNVNFCIRGVEGESLLIRLDQQGICAGSGAACSSGSLEPSHVLRALGLSHADAYGSLRLSLGRETTREETDLTADSLREIVRELRTQQES